jgi:putative transposase
MTPESACYPRHSFPAEIISYAVWLYHVFSLSLRDVELLHPREHPALVPEVRR